MSMLKVENLRKSYGGTEVLRGIGFTLEKGEVLCIIGSSGGGKTTLLRCLNLLEIPTQGRITLDSEVIFDSEQAVTASEQALRRNRKRFGLVFQSFNLFPQFTVLGNVTLAPTLHGMGTAEEINARARELIARVGLADKADEYPKSLSGGQQQRVAIARALALEPEILCFDEPTSALDPELTGEVLSVIRKLRDSGTTMIIVTHEMEFARRVADRVMFVAEGKTEELGTSEQLFGAPESEHTRAFINARRNESQGS